MTCIPSFLPVDASLESKLGVPTFSPGKLNTVFIALALSSVYIALVYLIYDLLFFLGTARSTAASAILGTITVILGTAAGSLTAPLLLRFNRYMNSNATL